MLRCQDQRRVANFTRCNSLIQSTVKRGGKDEDRCDSLLLPATDAANPCLQESLHPHYRSIDFSSPPTEQDTALDNIVEDRR